MTEKRKSGKSVVRQGVSGRPESTGVKYVYRFGQNEAEGNAEMRNLLGGKGANLAEMSRLGLPVPAGFTITTECCNEYFALNGNFPPELKAQVEEALAVVEKQMGRKYGDPKNPLLVSCRSGARKPKSRFFLTGYCQRSHCPSKS